MANTMKTFIEVKNINEASLGFVRNITTPVNDFQVTTIDVVNRMYNTDYTWSQDATTNNWPSREYMAEWIGSKWITIEQDIVNESECRLIVESAWDVPVPFLQQFANKLAEHSEDSYIVGTYEDESYNPMGAFVFGKDYDDVEDYEEVDEEKMWEDDDYRDDVYSEIELLKENLEDSYIEYLIDKKNNPEDYVDEI